MSGPYDTYEVEEIAFDMIVTDAAKEMMDKDDLMLYIRKSGASHMAEAIIDRGLGEVRIEHEPLTKSYKVVTTLRLLRKK